MAQKAEMSEPTVEAFTVATTNTFKGRNRRCDTVTPQIQTITGETEFIDKKAYAQEK